MNTFAFHIQKGPILFLLCFSFLFFSCSDVSPDTNEDGNASATQSYPLDYCVVSGNDLNDKDTGMIPFTYNYKGTSIVFCCKPCLPKFKKDPEKYMAVIKEEMEYLKKDPAG
tara:strand:+ start:721 stop:1056 length:336 start_codon:yes stop_codon:yes gene_type:complete